MKQAMEIVEAHGFEAVHGIVDSMWLRKPESTPEEYEAVCEKLRDQLDLPISFEGRYKWIVFLNSKVDWQTSVLNRYYGVFEDGTLKVRGIELRKHDTPRIVGQCEEKMLEVLSKAANTQEFHELVPEALKVLMRHVSRVRQEKIPIEDLVVVKGLSKNPGEYTNLVPQAIAARQVRTGGGSVHAGQRVSYVLTLDRSRIEDNRARPSQFVDESTPYDKSWYEDLLVSSAANLLMPLGLDKEQLKHLLHTDIPASRQSQN